MSSNISEQISNFVSSHNFLELDNIKSSSNSSNNKISSSSNNIATYNSVEIISAYQNLTSLIRNILKIFITPENFKKYEKIEDYYEENVSNEIIKDLKEIANEIEKLKDKEEELRRPKNMESIGLNTDINFEYISLSEAMKGFQQKNNELLSQVSIFKKAIKDLQKKNEFLTNYIKENINNSLKNTSDIISEEDFYKNGFQSKSKKNINFNPNNSNPYIGKKNGFPLLRNSFSNKFINKFRPHKILIFSPSSLPNKYKFNENQKTFNNNNKSKVKFKIKNNLNSRSKSKNNNNKISVENNKSFY